jgi:hypothetical protein
MNASLLSAIQTEPWSLLLLGATLFALSSIARRRSTAAVSAKSLSASAIDGSLAARELLPRTVETAEPTSRPTLQPMLGSSLNTAV